MYQATGTSNTLIVKALSKHGLETLSQIHSLMGAVLYYSSDTRQPSELLAEGLFEDPFMDFRLQRQQITQLFRFKHK